MSIILNGSSQYGLLPAESLFNNSAVYTYCVWFKPDSGATTEQHVFGGFHTGGLTRFSGTVYRGDQGTKNIAKYKSSSTSYYSVGVPTADAWNIHVFSRSVTGGAAGASRGILNGGTPSTATTEENSATDLARFGFGARRDSTGAYVNYYDGKIYCVAIWNRVLNTTEEAQLASGTAPSAISSGLVDYFEFTGSGTPATSTSLNSRVVTWTGSPTLDTDTPFASITTINGSAYGAVKAGSSGNTITVPAGFTPTSGTHGGKAISALSGSAGSYTFTSAAYVDAATFPEPDTTQTFQLTNGVSSPTASSVFSSPDLHTSVVLASPNTTDNTYVTYYIPTASNGDRIVYPTESGDFAVSADGKITCVEAGVRVLWHWNSSDSIMTRLNITVNEAGQVTSFGLTSAGLTSIGLTRVGLTSSGL